MATCPFCRQAALRIIAVITQVEVIRTILRHLKLSVDPSAIAPARSRQAAFAWVAAHNVLRGLVGDVCAVEECLTPLTACAIPFAMPPSLAKTACPASSPWRPPLQPSLPP